jgi:hypothetical protein
MSANPINNSFPEAIVSLNWYFYLHEDGALVPQYVAYSPLIFA